MYHGRCANGEFIKYCQIVIDVDYYYIMIGLWLLEFEEQFTSNCHALKFKTFSPRAPLIIEHQSKLKE